MFPKQKKKHYHKNQVTRMNVTFNNSTIGYRTDASAGGNEN